MVIKKDRIDDYFEQEKNLKGINNKKGIKSIKFLKKLSDEVGMVFKKRILNINKNVKSASNVENINLENLSYGNDDYENIKKENEIKKEKRLLVFGRLHSNYNEIEKQEKENNKLRELIAYEEEKHKYLNISVNNDNNNMTTNFIESSCNFSNKKKRNRNNNLSFLPISQNASRTIDTFINNNKKSASNISNSYNNNEVITSSTLVPKNNSIFNVEKDEKKNKLNKNINNSAISSSNNFFVEKKIHNMKKYHSSKNISEKIVSESKMAEKILKRRKLSSININTLNNAYGVPSIHFNEIYKKRRESFLPIMNFSRVITTSGNRSHESKKKARIFSLRNSISQPNVLNKKKTIKEIYEQISKIKFSPHKKKKNNDNLDILYKNLYGDKMPKFNRKSNDKEILINYCNIKNNIIGNEHKNIIYLRYRELLPVETITKIKKDNELNKELIDNPLFYAKAICNKKFQIYENKNE